MEHRRCRRHPIHPLICFYTPSKGELCLLHEISLLGALLANPDPPAVDTRVELMLAESELKGLRLPGRVVRRVMGDRPGFAVEFDDPQKTLIDHLFALA